MKYTKESQSLIHLLYTPFTGLGLYNGFRGNKWLKNRIKIFKQFVIPSLLAQTNKHFILWISWRKEERNNPQVWQLKLCLDKLGIENIFTYSGVCFWDDKYKDDVAWDRLVMALHGAMNDLISHLTEETILMTIQPSDDCYRRTMVDEIQKTFEVHPDAQVMGYSRGYIMNYQTKEVAEYNPTTNPPFFTIKFPKDIFIDPLKHMQYTGPYKSHEYVGQCLKYYITDERGFIVGTHLENISTHFNHPFKGSAVKEDILNDFGLLTVEPLKIQVNLGRRLLRKLPHKIQRRLRYWFGERLLSKFSRI